ncbi:MAG TPA: hypothetical protein VE843_09860, partial [Ktedonobacteraceae bacterium]|nr:hypothetical protein [Ktedonobacteraceae bacterium]
MASRGIVDHAFKTDAPFAKAPILSLISIGVALVVFGLIVYSGFVFGQKTLLYKDVGADSLNTFYPNYI